MLHQIITSVTQERFGYLVKVECTGCLYGWAEPVPTSAFMANPQESLGTVIDRCVSNLPCQQGGSNGPNWQATARLGYPSAGAGAGFGAIRAAAAAGKRASSGVELPVEKRADSIRAKRVAFVTVDESGHIGLRGVTIKTPILAEMDAECMLTTGEKNPDTNHAAPHHTHGCGIHAQKHYGAPCQYFPHEIFVGLDVELSGRVVEHEYGYRAQHMRVLAIEVPKKCRCGGPAVPSALSGFMDFLCPGCSHGDRSTFSLVDIANATGIETRWWDGSTS